MDGFTPTKHTNECTDCHRRFVISREALDMVKRDIADEIGPVGLPTDEDAVERFDVCIECITGEPYPAERVG